MDPKVKRIIKDIKSLKIQGARNVAKSVIKALIIQIENSKTRSLNSLYSELLVVSDSLAAARPTEPMVRNAIKDITDFTFMQIRSGKSVKQIKKEVVIHNKEYLSQMKKNAEKLWDYGAKLIQNGNVIMTHCHSSTATGILRRANEMGKKFKVIACETRPKLQGRLTAKELVKAGIDTTLVVDGAMNVFMRKVDLCLVGADAITSTGNMINKIGTSTLAHIARFHDVPLYCAAELYKYNPLSLYGNREKIEERSTKEIWERPPKKLKIKNLAFDTTESRYISAYITEEGIIPPESFLSVVSKKLR